MSSFACTADTNHTYSVHGNNTHDGRAVVNVPGSGIVFDGSRGRNPLLPGPAHLLASALAACLLKNVERFSEMLSFEYSRAQVEVELTRQDVPAQIVRSTYTLAVYTDEPLQRCTLMHRNIRKFGTVTNTIDLACGLTGVMRALRPNGQVESVMLANAEKD